ncbi:hypothetical protein F383_31002 [Gossypium arboreum]|uniref:Uncharacterized protein n=1 Tax=Gossypium arboreum TaxID=29729 RepID=A0A0B0PIT4_GOSAR|nr:hypothetical protein F383_31002 [Gossypium arboreum]
MTHGQVHSHVFPSFDFEINSVCSTRPHTRACDLAVWHKSVYPIGLARPGIRMCMAISRVHGLATRACVLAV